MAPVCKAQPWYADLLHVFVDHPRLISHTPLTSNQGPTPLAPPQLAVRHILGRSTTSCSSRRAQRQKNLTTHSISGVASVSNGVQIPIFWLICSEKAISTDLSMPIGQQYLPLTRKWTVCVCVCVCVCGGGGTPSSI